MLNQVKKIKNLGVFDNYAAPAEIPAFSRFNVVYGENGSGKTTFSRLLACLEAGEHPDYPNLEYAIESQSGTFTHGTRYARKVRVFNSDYVDANIGRLDGPLRHILILGEENKALANELKSEIETRDTRNARIQAIDSELSNLGNSKGRLFSQIAKTIGEATSGATLRSYRKPDAESAFANLENAQSLSDDELKVHRTTVRQEQMEIISPVKVPAVIGTDKDALTLAGDAIPRARAFSMRSAQSNVIERLVQNADISAWVEEGVHIHSSHEHDRCEFCDQPLPADRLKALVEHFSVEDQKLKEEIDSERDMLDEIISALSSIDLPDRLAFYAEMRAEYDDAARMFEDEISQLKNNLRKVDGALAEKQTRRTTAYQIDINADIAPTKAALAAITAIISRHNQKSASFDEEKTRARNAIEQHYLLSIQDQISEIGGEIDTLEAETTLLRDGGEELPDTRSLEEISQSVIDKQAQVSSAHAGGDDLTKHLKQFLGRTDLRFESGDDGYRVLRRGKPAKRLSEGEKNAIAFLYFLVQLRDRDFDIAEGVVVIDDPISSLDASAIYQAFSFLKNEAQGAKQLFILTHNFEFLRLLINWLKNIPGPKSDKTYSMVLCAETEDRRSARLASLDRLLIDHATEYHYLFKVLHTFKSDGTIMGCYHVPNIARKVLETFLDFHVPSNKKLYLKLEQTDFDQHKKTAIFKFANDLSHHTGKSFDPAIVAETQKNVEYLLEMIETVAPLHYEGLKSLSEG